ncbi:MAG: hypothetical protein ISR65_17575 [Bacteriovoracaceae bacterium]|nr:hypothetical protein [Bacteriovoracaceae bacterium]
MKKLILTLSLLTLSKLTMAVPSAFTNNCGALDIVNDTTSTVLRDNEDCSTAWVLPPTYGLTSLTGYTPNGNLGFCQEIKDIQGVLRSLVARMAKIYKEIEGLKEEYTEKEKKYLEAKSAVHLVERSLEYQEISDLDDKIVELQEDIDELMDQRLSCVENCGYIRDEMSEKKEERRNLKKRLLNLKREYFETVREHRKAQARLDSAQFALNNIETSIQLRSDKTTKLKTTLQQWLAFYSKLEGGTAHLDYDTGWTQNTINLNEKYDGRYQFKQVATRNARINANFVGAGDKDTYLSSMPAILDYVIDGIKFTPWGDNEHVEHTALPSRLAGSVRLSLMGGCPMYYKNFLESENLVRDETLNKKMDFALSSTYEYPAAFKFKVTAKYNLYKFYEKIATSSSRGGFFSRKHYKSIVENKIDKDAFTIDWQLEDESYSKEEKEEIRKSLKSDLIARVLGTMATPIYSTAPSVYTYTPMQTRSGAIVVAQGINQTCGYFSIYCRGAYWVLRGLDAIWGSSRAESRYRSTHDRTAEETWSTSEAKWRAAATGFVGRKI